MKKIIMIVICTTTFFSSCGIYNKYKRGTVTTDSLYRDPINDNYVVIDDTTNFGNMPWQEVFTDPILQSLIKEGLEKNVDFQTAVLSVEQAKAMLSTARLAYLPSLSLNPSATVVSWDKGKATQTYSLPIQSSWSIDLFGKLTNAKRAQKALFLQANDYKQAVRTALIAGIANSYYSLLMLDKQKEIVDNMEQLSKDTYEMMIAQKKFSGANESAVQSAKANYFSTKAQAEEMKRQIREVENSLSLLLCSPPRSFTVSSMEEQVLPSNIKVGVGLQLLSNRPDVHAAEMNLANCFYQENKARSAFYPNITISGSAGWTNSTGAMIVNPGKLLASAVASLTQPLFNHGLLVAQLKVAKAEKEKAELAWQQAVLNAGAEVSNALMLYQTSEKKVDFEQQQVESLERNVDITKKRFKLDNATYPDIIIAQQQMLNAKISLVQDQFNKMQAIVNLYNALGGGREQSKEK